MDKRKANKLLDHHGQKSPEASSRTQNADKSDTFSISSSHCKTNSPILQFLEYFCICFENPYIHHLHQLSYAARPPSKPTLIKKSSLREVVIETQLIKKFSRDWSENIRIKRQKERALREKMAKTQQETFSLEIPEEEIPEELFLKNMIKKPDNFSNNQQTDSETESINLDELVSTFQANMNKQNDISSIGMCSIDETVPKTVSYSQHSKGSKGPTKVRNMHDYFQQKLLTDMIKCSGDDKKKKNKKSYHNRLLDKGLDSGINGKMVQYEDYHAFNSDDSSDISDTFESSLFYRYGMASQFLDNSLKNNLMGNRKAVKKKKRPKAEDGEIAMDQDR